MTNAQHEARIWHAAVEWVIREHGTLDAEDRKELIDWLKKDPAHRAAYEEASRIWLITGLIPSSSTSSDE